MARYVRNCFWLMVPVLAFNVLFARALPRAFQPDVFSRDIPLGITLPENVLRGLLMVLLLMMPLAPPDSRTRLAGICVYFVGLALYFASWTMLILRPNHAWSTTALGFTAPAWTPIFWLAGIALLSDKRLIAPVGFYRPWMFVLVCVLFLVFHNAHAALVFTRQL